LLDSGAGSLRQAVLDAPEGGTVDFQTGLSGRITLTSGELLISKDLTIAGPGASRITVSGSNSSRVFDIQRPEPLTSITVAISGLTIADGSATGFLAGRGGGIYDLLCTLTISDCLLTGNAGRTGGGIDNEGGTMTVLRCTLKGNSVGGSSDVVGGGGIDNSGTLTITDSTLEGNSAPGPVGGGGAIVNGDMMTMTNCTISNNTAFVGGGIVNNNAGVLIMTDCTLTGNSAVPDGTGTVVGGAIYTEGGPLTLTGCTISANSSGAIGGGIYSGPSGGATLRNTIVAGNTAPSGPDVSGGAISSQGHNLIGDGSGGSGFISSDLVGTSAHPIDPLLGPLQGNGGPTQTIALLPGSPAINAGDNTGAPDFDQRGFPRIVGGTIDIGAFELQPAGQATHLAFEAPTSVRAGTAFTATVTVLDDFGQLVVDYTGTVHFTASTGGHRDYTFTTGDLGQHTFSGLILRQAGPLTITGTDATNPPISGTVTFPVTPAAPDHLSFDVLSTVTAGVPFAITVTVEDIYGNTVTDFTDTVHFAASRAGDVFASRDYAFTAADAGQHTFTGLVLDQPGDYTITGDDAMAGIRGSVSFTVNPG
jgi:hypothetical protein